MTKVDQPDPFEHTRMTLGGHLAELQKRLLRGVLAVMILFGVAWYFQGHVAQIAIWPFERAKEWVKLHRVEEAEEILAADPSRPRSDFFEPAESKPHVHHE
jgi:Sec-independent protein secretion pathway component TatC